MTLRFDTGAQVQHGDKPAIVIGRAFVTRLYDLRYADGTEKQYVEEDELREHCNEQS